MRKVLSQANRFDRNRAGRIRPASEDTAAESAVKRGRKQGKHSDASYTQTSLYLPIELRNKVRAKLYEQGKELSGLVEGMLKEWLSKQA